MSNEEKILAILAEIKVTQEKQGQALEEHSKMFEKMQDDITAIKVRLDYDVDKRFDALAEGQAMIEKRLNTLDEVKELAEETRDRVDAIHAAVVQHSAAITELKQAK